MNSLRFYGIWAAGVFSWVVICGTFSYAQLNSRGERNISQEQELDRLSQQLALEGDISEPVTPSYSQPAISPQTKTPPENSKENQEPFETEMDAEGLTFEEAQQLSFPPSSVPIRTKVKNIAKPDPEQKIDALQFKDMEINDVLNLMSDKMGLNIIAGRNVTGKVTIFLKDVNLWDALRIILESNDLAYVQDGNIIRILTSAEYEFTYGHKFAEKVETKVIKLYYARAADVTLVLNQVKSLIGKAIADEKSNTLILIDTPEKVAAMAAYIQQIDVARTSRVYDLSYAKAEDVYNKVKEVMTPTSGEIRFDPRSNKLIVTDTPINFKQIEQVIDAFDVQEKEVLIEAKIIQVVLSDDQQWGIDWEAIVSDYHDLTLSGNFDVLGTGSKKGTIGIGTLSDDNFTVLLEALNTTGETNILSNPHITTLNNQEAKILVGSTEPYVTTTTTTPAAGPTTTAETVNFIEVGIKLYVTPIIHNDGFITMKIKPEVSSVTRNLTTSNNNTIPVVETSEAETTVMAKEGVTIIIGGLIKDETINEIKSVPFLGRVPVMGALFRSEDKLSRKTELVIFLTTKILTGDVSMDRAVGPRTESQDGSTADF